MRKSYCFSSESFNVAVFISLSFSFMNSSGNPFMLFSSPVISFSLLALFSFSISLAIIGSFAFCKSAINVPRPRPNPAGSF